MDPGKGEEIQCPAGEGSLCGGQEGCETIKLETNSGVCFVEGGQPPCLGEADE